MPINALDSEFITPVERDAILDYTLDVDIREGLNKAVAKAIAEKESLYIPAGLWLIKANTPSTATGGLKINVLDNPSLLIFGDGDATIIRRQATRQMDRDSSLVRIIANNAIQVTFQNLLFDGNEANCPIDEGVVFNADGVTSRFDFQLREEDSPIGVTFTINGVEMLLFSENYTLGGTYPSRFVIFKNVPLLGTKIRIHRTFFYEQCANVRFAKGSGIPDRITFENVTMTGCVGDGFQANLPIQNLQVTNWRSYGRTRRPRADIQLSRIPLQVTNITNFIGDAFEMEPSETNTEHIINLNNMLVRGAFDLTGDGNAHPDGTPPNFANVQGSNIIHLCQIGVGLAFSNFFRVRGEFSDCSFVDTDRIGNCQVKFQGGKFAISSSVVGSANAKSIFIFQSQVGSFIEFNGVAFKLRGKPSLGSYFRYEAQTDLEQETRFINCRTIDRLDYFASADRWGTVVFDGGQLEGNKAAILIAHGGNIKNKPPEPPLPPFVIKTILKNPEGWGSNSLIEIGSAGGLIQIEMSGSFDAEKIQPIANMTPRSSRNIRWSGGFVGAVTSDPNGRIEEKRIRGLPGLILVKSLPTIQKWQYSEIAKYAETSYDPI